MKADFRHGFKKILLLAVLLSGICILCSCEARERDHLSYQSYPIRARCELFINDESYPLVLDLPCAGSARFGFTGSRLEGTAITVSGGDAVFVNGRESFPLAALPQSPLFLVVGAFALEPRDMVSVTEGQGELLVRYARDGIDIAVSLRDGLPVAIDIGGSSGELRLEINEFTNAVR